MSEGLTQRVESYHRGQDGPVVAAQLPLRDPRRESSHDEKSRHDDHHHERYEELPAMVWQAWRRKASRIHIHDRDGLNSNLAVLTFPEPPAAFEGAACVSSPLKYHAHERQSAVRQRVVGRSDGLHVHLTVDLDTIWSRLAQAAVRRQDDRHQGCREELNRLQAV